MKCPHCNKTPVSFLSFLLIGWVRFRCRHCSATLVLTSAGDRFWGVLGIGLVTLGFMWFFLDYPYRAFGETATVIIFVCVAVLMVCTSMYYAWRDSTVAPSDHSGR
jgi:hypothetical protein